MHLFWYNEIRKYVTGFKKVSCTALFTEILWSSICWQRTSDSPKDGKKEKEKSNHR
jgi:hypothetical protein